MPLSLAQPVVSVDVIAPTVKVLVAPATVSVEICIALRSEAKQTSLVIVVVARPSSETPEAGLRVT